MLAPTLVSNIYLGSARVKKRVTRADNVRFGRPPLHKWVKSGHLLSEKKHNRDNCDFATKQSMFGVLVIVVMFHYHELLK